MITSFIKELPKQPSSLPIPIPANGNMSHLSSVPSPCLIPILTPFLLRLFCLPRAISFIFYYFLLLSGGGCCLIVVVVITIVIPPPTLLLLLLHCMVPLGVALFVQCYVPGGEHLLCVYLVDRYILVGNFPSYLLGIYYLNG